MPKRRRKTMASCSSRGPIHDSWEKFTMASLLSPLTSHHPGTRLSLISDSDTCQVPCFRSQACRATSHFSYVRVTAARRSHRASPRSFAKRLTPSAPSDPWPKTSPSLQTLLLPTVQTVQTSTVTLMTTPSSAPSPRPPTPRISPSRVRRTKRLPLQVRGGV